ncbi:MAG TPA: T9SS type A sorting domain-containing protein, partial [Candidatus Edwardsbacteria bacterium]|nr:T9SS type A sorting domain-containing protein [Candidatus Edwardsbacteria bacterium]
DRLYPNPFAEQAVISYQVPAAGRVSLKVYNIAGQLVATLADGEQQPGYYAARWNGKTQGQYSAASGVYLVRLSYGDQTRTEKLVKVR